MLTIFAIPKAFEKNIALIQENAILNWVHVIGANVILFGDESGVKEFSKKHNITHIEKIPKNSYGTPLISEAFKLALQHSKDGVIGYVNSDIMFEPKLNQLFQPILKIENKNWMMVGQRIDLDVSEKINFNKKSWEKLHKRALIEGALHGKSGIDFFFYDSRMAIDMPEFAVGRPGWDNWLLMDILKKRGLLVDATRSLLAIHQNHPPRYSSKSDESVANIKLAISNNDLGTINNCTHILIDLDGKITVNISKRGILMNLKIIQKMLLIKRKINLGIRCI